MSWFWRTKPRSIIKTVHWFPYFAELQGKNWDEISIHKSNFTKKAVHPVRRNYIYQAHKDEDSSLSNISYEDYVSGQMDKKETESNGRNDKTTFEFFGFGYVNKDGIICNTEVGNLIVQGLFDQEHYLKQLLKVRIPNLIHKTKDKDPDAGVFPFQLVLTALKHFESLNRSELALLFGCIKNQDIPIMLTAIRTFKEEYELLPKKNNTKAVKKLFETTFLSYYKNMPNQIDSYYDYAEALSRSLIYTGLFSISGRSIASKIRVAAHSKKKVALLQEKFQFTFPSALNTVDSYMHWFGSATNVTLPWEKLSERKEIIADKAEILQTLLNNTSETAYHQKAIISPEELKQILIHSKTSTQVSDLKNLEHILSSAITSHNEDYFIKVSSKTPEERFKILEKFDDILANDDMSALWLEVNTWKSLIAIQGTQILKRNFKIEDDLSPRSFAPGVGNTPDMELYKENYIIIPEVSLMTGVRQWEHEASSVIDHVMSFIKKYQEKQVLGLFISSQINLRTLWQFFILNRESWIGCPVPVVPLTIAQYVSIITFLYENQLNVDYFKELIEYLSKMCKEYKTYEEWGKDMDSNITHWKKISIQI